MAGQLSLLEPLPPAVNGTKPTSRTTAELAARALAGIPPDAPSMRHVRRALAPAALREMLAWHVEQGHVERLPGDRWRLTPEGRRVFGGLIDLDARLAA